MHVVAQHARLERNAVEVQAAHPVTLAHAGDGGHHGIEALDVENELGIERLDDEIGVDLALLQQGHDARQIAQFGAGDRIDVRKLVAGRRIQGRQILLVVIVAHVVGIVAAQVAFDVARLVRQAAPLALVEAGRRRPGHEAVRRHRQLAARFVGRRLLARLPPQRQLVLKLGDLAISDEPQQPPVGVVCDPRLHLLARARLVPQAVPDRARYVLGERAARQLAARGKPGGRHHDHQPRVGRQRIRHRLQHADDPIGLEHGMAVGQRGHLQLFREETVGHETQVVAGQLGRAEHDQRAVAQGIAQAVQVDVLRAPVRPQVGQVVALAGRGGGRLHGVHDAAEHVVRAAIGPDRQCHRRRGSRDVRQQPGITKYG
ncbi:hypothetical protein D9M68_604130 [compost metagenome]